MKRITMFVAAIAALCAMPATAEVTLKMSSFANKDAVTGTYVVSPWIKGVTADAGGEIKVQEYWGGTLGRGPDVQLKLLMDGVSDVSLVTMSNLRGKFPESVLFSLPFMFRSAEESSLAFWRMYERKQMAGFDGIKVLALFTTTPSGIHTTKPIKTLDDVDGLKIRGTGATQVATLKLAGAAPVSLPINKVAESLSRGVIDGAMISLSGVNSFKAESLLRYHLLVPLSNNQLMLAMRQEQFDKLPAKLKAAIDRNSGEQSSRMGGKGFDIENGELIKKWSKLPDQTFIEPSAEQFAAWRQKFVPLHDQWKADHPDGKKQYDALEAILAEIRAGR